MQLGELSIRNKLALGFIGISFFIIITSILAIYQIRKIGQNAVQMYEHPLTVSNAVRDINVYINAIHRSMKDVALSTNKEQIDSARMLVDEYNNKVLDAFDLVFERFLGNKEDVEDAYRSFLAWENIRNEVIELKLSDKNYEAAQITRGKGARHVEELLKKTQVMTDYAQNMAFRYYNNTVESSRRSTLLLTGIFGSIFILSIFFAYYFSSIITRPVRSFITEVKDIFEVQSNLPARINRLNENQLFFAITKELKSSYTKIKEANKKLKLFNEELELKIEERTSTLKKNEFVLKQSIEEYQALNEEYLAQNEEIAESLERIQKFNEELSIAKNKAEESDKLKSAFLANMSHEIRTPMNGIIGFSEMFANSGLSQEQREHYASVVVQSAHQLLSIVNDILDISRIETGQVVLKKEQVEVNKMINSLHEFYEPSAVKLNLKFTTFQGLTNKESTILTDKTKLYQILNNLLNNAFKFTHKGEINFGYRLVNNELNFYVKDTGIGISPEYHDKIFERFRQAEVELTTQYGGTGLGLAISKKLTEYMGGKMWLESEINKGSVFYFTIPYITETLPKQQIKETHVESLTSIRNIKVLIAEDEDINYLYLKEVLNDKNIEIIRAFDGEEVIELYKNNPDISLILMDIKMPRKNGYDATRELKKLNPNLPIIAQTAYAMVEDMQKASEAKCDDYISKPIVKQELFDIINKYIS